MTYHLPRVAEVVGYLLSLPAPVPARPPRACSPPLYVLVHERPWTVSNVTRIVALASCPVSVLVVLPVESWL